MKNKLLIACLASSLATSIFAKELVLTGEQAVKNTNQFKEALNIPKKGTINTIVLNGIELPVETNLEKTIYNNHIHDSKYYFSKESLEKIVDTYVGEDFDIANSGKEYKFSIVSGKVNIDYMVEENSQIQNHVTKVEITLKMKLEVAGKNPIEVTKTLDHTLGVKGDNYDWTITTTKDYNFDSLDTQIKNIMETVIFKFLNEKGL